MDQVVGIVSADPSKRAEGLIPFVRSVAEKFSILPEEDLRAIVESGNWIKGNKNDILVNAGEVTHFSGFVLNGLFKGYSVNAEGKEAIGFFCLEGSFLGALAALITHSPSHIFIQAMEDYSVLSLNYDRVEAQFKKSHVWSEFGRKLLEHHYIAKEQKEFEHHTLDAEERFFRMTARYPGILERASKSDIASYVGIAPESLSRILKKIRKVKT